MQPFKLLDRVVTPAGIEGRVGGIAKSGRISVFVNREYHQTYRPEQLRRPSRKPYSKRVPAAPVRQKIPVNHDPHILALAKANGVSYRFAAKVLADKEKETKR